MCRRAKNVKNRKQPKIKKKNLLLASKSTLHGNSYRTKVGWGSFFFLSFKGVAFVFPVLFFE